VTERFRERWLWWLFMLLAVVVIYKILTFDMQGITLVETNASAIEAAKIKLQHPESELQP
jgi:hypothetical protein